MLSTIGGPVLSDLENRTWLRVAGGALLVLHGVIHTVGFLLLWRIAELGEFTYDMATPDAGTWPGRFVGAAWLAAAALFVVAGLLLTVGRPSWRAPTLAGVIVSIPALLVDIGDAPAGLIVDAVLLVVLVAPRLSGRSGQDVASGARPDLNRIATALQVPPVHRRFASDMVDDLPEPARRYLTASIAEGTPLFQAVRITMHGEIKLGSRWVHFDGEELLAPHHGFCWTARTRIGVSGSDHYAAGAGALHWRLLGLLPVMRAHGADVSRSARGRAAGEALWLPTALLPEAGTSWEERGERAAARITTDGHDTVLELAVDEDGLVQSAGFDRWGDPDGTGTFALHRFGMDVTDHGTFGGLTIPIAGSAGWHHGTDRWPAAAFFRFELTDVTPVADVTPRADVASLTEHTR